MFVELALYLFAMLIPAAFDVVDGKELQRAFSAASAYEIAATVVRQDGKTYSQISRFAGDGVGRADAIAASAKKALGHSGVTVKEVGVQRQVAFAIDTDLRGIAIKIWRKGPNLRFASSYRANNFRPMRAKPVMAESHVAIVAQGLEAVGQAVFFKDQADVGNGAFPTILPPVPVYVVNAQELKEVDSATDATRLAAAGIVRQDFGPNKTGAIQIFCVDDRFPALSANGLEAERMLGARRKELCGEREVGFALPASLAGRLDLRLIPASATSRFETDKIVGVDRLLCAARATAKPEVMKPGVSVGELKNRPAVECLAGEVFEAFGAADKMQLSHDASLEQSVVVRVLAAVTSSRQDSFILSLFPHKTTSVELT